MKIFSKKTAILLALPLLLGISVNTFAAAKPGSSTAQDPSKLAADKQKILDAQRAASAGAAPGQTVGGVAITPSNTILVKTAFSPN